MALYCWKHKDLSFFTILITMDWKHLILWLKKYKSFYTTYYYNKLHTKYIVANCNKEPIVKVVFGFYYIDMVVEIHTTIFLTNFVEYNVYFRYVWLYIFPFNETFIFIRKKVIITYGIPNVWLQLTHLKTFRKVRVNIIL